MRYKTLALRVDAMSGTSCNSLKNKDKFFELKINHKSLIYQ